MLPEREANHSLVRKFKGKNPWIFTAISPCTFKALGLIDQTDNYTRLFSTRWWLSPEQRKALSYSVLSDILKTQSF